MAELWLNCGDNGRNPVCWLWGIVCMYMGYCIYLTDVMHFALGLWIGCDRGFFAAKKGRRPGIFAVLLRQKLDFIQYNQYNISIYIV